MPAAERTLVLETNATFAFSFKYKPGFVDEFDGDGVSTTFDLSNDLTQNHKFVVEGIIVTPTKASLSKGTGALGVDQITFDTAPPIGTSNVKIIFNSPKDLTGFTGKMQIRRTIDSTDYEFELTDGNGKIIFGPSRGVITFTLPVSDTATVDFEDGIYDFFLTGGAPSASKKIMKGPIDVEFSVTR